MTNAQFYFAIGVPMFSILLVWLGSIMVNTHAIRGLSQRIDDLSQRIDDMGQRIDDMGQRIDDMGQRIGDLSQRIDGVRDDLRSEMRAGFEAVNKRLDRLEVRFDRIEDEVRKDHESRLARLEARVFTSAA